MFSLVNIAAASILVYLSNHLTSWSDITWVIVLCVLEAGYLRMSKK
jgi:hypothetical protein